MGRGQITDANSYLFASDVHAPRRRRPNDWLTLVTTTLLLGLLWWAADLGELATDIQTSRVVLHPPEWIKSLAWVVYTSVGAYVVVLVVATVLRAGTTRGVVRDVTLVTAVTAAVAVTAARTVSGAWPDVLPELFTAVESPAFPAFRLALVVGVLGVLGPHLALPVRRIGRWAIGSCALATLLLGFTPLSGVIAAVLAGRVVTAAISLVFGSPDGLPPVSRLHDALSRLAVEAEELAYDSSHGEQVGRAVARDTAGRPLIIKVYGRDAADAQRAARLWQRAWYRSVGPSPGASQLRQAQHEALGVLLADRAGIEAGELLAVGEDDGGDALVVVARPPGHQIGSFTDEGLSDEQLRSAWRDLERLHAQRLAHGSIGPNSLLISDHDIGWTDFASCAVSATPLRLKADVAALLATTAAVVGPDRAIGAAVDTWSTDALADAIPYLQERALPPFTRRWVDDRDVEVDDLRKALGDALEVEPPKAVELRRVTLGGIAMVVFGVIAANAIVSQIAEIGFDVLVDQLAAASVGWIVAAFLLRLLAYVTGWMSLRTVLGADVPLGPTCLLQSAKGFVGLVVPSTVGRVAMDVRYLQKVGTPTPVAVAQGPLIGLVGFLVEILLLLLTAGPVTSQLEAGAITVPAVGGLIAAAVVVVIVALVVVFAVPSLRDRVLPPVREALGSIRGVVSSPIRLAKLFGSEGLDRVIGSLGLAAVAVAFGHGISLGQAVFVTVGTGLLAGLAPVPGGVGVAEAMLTGLLTAIGIPPQEAFAIAITYRLATSYLPPALGFFSLRWLTNNKYL